MRLKLTLFCNFLLFAVLMSSDGILILQVQKHYGVSSGVAGILGSCRDLSVAVGALLLSAYVARLGYKRSMQMALLLVIAICLWVPIGNSFATIELMFVVTGVAFSLMKSAIFASIGLVAHSTRKHASIMSYLEATYALGTFAGYFVFSAYADVAGSPTAWLKVYFVLALVSGMALLLLCSAKLDESEVQVEERQPLLSDLLAMFKLAATAVAAAFVGCIFTYDMLSESVNKWLPTFNSEVLHIPVNLSIQLASIMAASAVIGRLLGGLVVRYVSWLAVLLVCLALAVCLVLVALPLARHSSGVAVTGWGSVPVAGYLFPLLGLATAPIYPIINSLVLSSLPARQQGAMSGLIILCSALGATAGSLITGQIFQTYGGATAFYWILLPIALLGISMAVLNNLERRATALRLAAGPQDASSPHPA